LNESVTDVIVARSHQADGLSRMIVWSIAAHAAAIVALLLWPDRSAQEPPRTIMTISLSGAPGPKTGGLTQIGAREVQAPKPAEAKPVETPPAPKTPAMTLPDPKIKPRERPKPERAPEESNAPKVSTGEKPQAGNARAETRGQGFGTGLSSTGGGGGPVQLDIQGEFCCPEYIIQMRTFIQRTWESNQGVVGSTGVKFTIQRNGTIQAPQIENPSGFDALDLAALRALQRTTLPPLPMEFPNNTLTVHMRFDYSR
jgi:protein TonB